ncbi:MAG: SIMPL domain-containing protein [Chloroflexota bacterium]
MPETERAIVVSGEATVRRMPDLAAVSLAVTVRDREVDSARDAVNRRASAILARLRELGIPEADVTSPSLTIQPAYDYRRGAKLTGYEASRPMTIRVRDLAALGPLLDGLVDDGSTQVHGTSMELAQADAASREALGAAVVAARGRAEALAAAAGLTLGEPLRIEEEGSGFAPMPRMMAMAKGAADESVPTEVAAGEVEISARIRAWFALG